MKSFLSLCVAMSLAVVPGAAVAQKYRVEAKGTLISDLSAPSVFGNPAPIFEVTAQFTVDYGTAGFLAAGTLFDNSNGFRLNEDAYLFDAGDLSNVNILGLFHDEDVLDQGFPDWGGYWRLLLTGPIGAPSRLTFVASNNILGDVSFGYIACPTGECYISTESGVYSYIDGGYGAIVDLSLSASPITTVPEPSAWAVMLFGFGVIGGLMRRRVLPRSLA